MKSEKLKRTVHHISSSGLSHSVKMNKEAGEEDALVVDQEIQEILQNGEVKQFHPSHKQYLSSIFIVPKKDITHKYMLYEHSGCKVSI